MNILKEILEYKKEEVKKLKQRYSYNSFKEMEFFEKSSLRLRNFLPEYSLGIIAEIKKASPSRGIIKEDFNHLKAADIYFSEEAAGVSVLTDKNFFKGDINYLKDIATIKQRPLLRKDFIIDEYQVFQAKAFGADIILLISELLSADQINELSSAAYELRMDVLLELHSKKQLSKINFKMNNLIGINNRNLEDFSVSIETTKNISDEIPDDVLIISESGISRKEDIDFLKTTKIKAILVGEYLMASKDMRDGIKQLKEWCLLES